MIDLPSLFGTAVLVGAAAGMAFGHLVTQAINEMDRRRRRTHARDFWHETWRVSR